MFQKGLFINEPKVNFVARRNGLAEQTVYQSSNGTLYTKKMTVDIANRGIVGDVLATYGVMDNLEELTLTGIMRHTSAINVLHAGVQSIWLNMPSLKRLIITSNDIRKANGQEYTSSDNGYDSRTGTGKLNVGHYAFANTNLEYLQLGSIGSLFQGGAYFRNDMPCPPGTSSTQIGSERGLMIVVYTDAYNAQGGFMSSVAPNTTLICLDWQTGEPLYA